MAEADLTLGVVLGLLIGIPVGIGVCWFIAQQFTGTLSTTKTYSNIEEWDVIKDERGRVKGVRVKRTAKED